MAGLGLLLLLAMYVGFSIFIAIAIYRAGAKRIAALISLFFISLPFVDAVAGNIYLNQLCDSGARVVIHRTSSPVDGIRIDNEPSIEAASYYGYQFVEGGNFLEGRVARSVKEFLGKPLLEMQVEPISSYILATEPRQEGLYIISERIVVREVRGEEILGEFRWYYFKGGWVQRLAMAFSDAGPGSAGSCGSFDVKKHLTFKLAHESLPPTNP